MARNPKSEPADEPRETELIEFSSPEPLVAMTSAAPEEVAVAERARFKVRTTIRPDQEIEVDEIELGNLTALGILYADEDSSAPTE